VFHRWGDVEKWRKTRERGGPSCGGGTRREGGRIEAQSVQQVIEELVGGFSLAPDIVDSFFE